jgi:hypothetical protein
MADLSPPSSAKIKSEQGYSSTPPICLQGVHWDNFTFTKIHNSSDGTIHSLKTYTYHEIIHVPTSNIPSQNMAKTLTEGGY